MTGPDGHTAGDLRARILAALVRPGARRARRRGVRRRLSEPVEVVVPGRLSGVSPKGGVITTETPRDATTWDQLVIDLGLDGPVRHGLRHTALTWMADSGSPLARVAAGRRPQDRAGDCPLSAPGHGRSGGGRQRVFVLAGAEWGPDSGGGS